MNLENKLVVITSITSAVISAAALIWTTHLNNAGSLETKKIDINSIREERVEREISEQCRYLNESYYVQYEKADLFSNNFRIINNKETKTVEEIKKNYDNYSDSLDSLKRNTEKLSTFLTQDEYNEYKKNSNMILRTELNDVFNSNLLNAYLIADGVREKVRSCNTRLYNLKNYQNDG